MDELDGGKIIEGNRGSSYKPYRLSQRGVQGVGPYLEHPFGSAFKVCSFEKAHTGLAFDFGWI